MSSRAGWCGLSQGTWDGLKTAQRLTFTALSHLIPVSLKVRPLFSTVFKDKTVTVLAVIWNRAKIEPIFAFFKQI